MRHPIARSSCDRQMMKHGRRSIPMQPNCKKNAASLSRALLLAVAVAVQLLQLLQLQQLHLHLQLQLHFPGPPTRCQRVAWVGLRDRRAPWMAHASLQGWIHGVSRSPTHAAQTVGTRDHGF